MVTGCKSPLNPRVLIVGNYCHDVLIRDGDVLAETLGGAASFISNVFDGLSIRCNLISKVGQDFKYETKISHGAIVAPSFETTVFHAYFDLGLGGDGREDRVLKRVSACNPITPMDLPDTRFDFGMAVGIGGEILPETLERMLEICRLVFVDIQALIRVFADDDGTVSLVNLKESGFYRLLPRIGVLKASSEEAVFVDVEVVRKWCCVVVTNGKEGCKVYWRDGELQIAPFLANQKDPTGAGDSFLGGFVAGLVQGLSVPDAALVGNFFGSLGVEQIGLPKFDLRMLQRVGDEVQRRKMQCASCCYERSDGELKFSKTLGHEQFHSSLGMAKRLSLRTVQERRCDLPCSPNSVDQSLPPVYTGQPKLLPTRFHEEPVRTIDNEP
ncbi:inositol 3-kinase-like [Tripterygium wilfordii]|nr:inositol 3-kinase-like [Tripterygium wilfordii]XP_038706980.1 inositol 3-kinase-like [Tripterygium wilfordii]XP_038706981.1 inositol 3-kinase-like [Tripterygium wilfordii]XP_038706982.1 inositol 3-kinase-like [Tripterygium wilfordii]